MIHSSTIELIERAKEKARIARDSGLMDDTLNAVDLILAAIDNEQEIERKSIEREIESLNQRMKMFMEWWGVK
jgi:hypothetical protein